MALLAFTQGLKETAAGFVHLGGSELGVFQANVSEPTASVLPESIVARLAASPEVARATPLLLIVEGVKADPAAIVFGADPAGFFTRNLVLTGGRRPQTGAHEVLVGDRLAAQLHLLPGRRPGDRGTPLPGRRRSTTRASCSRTPAPCSRSRRPSS